MFLAIAATLLAFAGAAVFGDTPLPPLTLGTQRIPRVAAPSLSEFWERFADVQSPVIITGYEACFASMSVANIEAVCGSKTVNLARKTNERGKWAGIGEYTGATQLSRVLRDPSLGGDDDAVIGLFDWPLQRNCSELLARHMRVPKYFAQDWLQRVPPQQPLDYRDGFPSLFVGRNGSFSSAHIDTFGSAFWQYVLEGEKEWQILDSTQNIDFFGPEARDRAVVNWHDVVRPGEVLYVPGTTLHQVRNIGATVSLAGNFVSRGNLGTMRAEVYKGTPSAAAGNAYAQVRASLFREDFDYSVDPNVGDMAWSTYKDQWKHFPHHATPPSRQTLIVSGAGSDEVNGEYVYDGLHDDTPQYVLVKKGRRFELFKVGASNWWNIQEFDGTQHLPVHYGALLTTLHRFDTPPRTGWEGKTGKATWRGVSPGPRITEAVAAGDTIDPGMEMEARQNEIERIKAMIQAHKDAMAAEPAAAAAATLDAAPDAADAADEPAPAAAATPDAAPDAADTVDTADEPAPAAAATLDTAPPSANPSGEDMAIDARQIEMQRIREMIQAHKDAMADEPVPAAAAVAPEAGEETCAGADAGLGTNPPAAEQGDDGSAGGGWDSTNVYAVPGDEDRVGPHVCGIDVVPMAKLSLDAFKTKYLGKRPVIVDNVGDGWPATTRWTRDRLKSK